MAPLILRQRTMINRPKRDGRTPRASLITTPFISAWRVAAAKALFSSVAMSCVFICQRACQCNATPNKSSAAVAMLTMPKPARVQKTTPNQPQQSSTGSSLQ